MPSHFSEQPARPLDETTAEHDRRDAITILCVLSVLCWFIGTFLYWAMGPGSFHVFDSEARLDLIICGSVGTMAPAVAAVIAVRGCTAASRGAHSTDAGR